MLPFARNLECCAPPLLSRNPGPCSCGQVLIVNFVLFDCLPAELFRRHGKPPVARRTAREARGVCVSSRTAQAEQGEGGDDEDQAWFVCPFRVCLDFASKAARGDVEEQAASAQTADPVEDAPKASERAVGLRFCSLKIPLQTVAFASAGAGLAAAEDSSGERGSSQNRKHGGKITPKHPCTRQDLAAARRARELALDGKQRAGNVVKELDGVVSALRRRWLQEFQANNTAKADEVKQELQDAKQELNDAKQELNDAAAKLEKAEQKYEAKASVRAGRVQAWGFCWCSCCGCLWFEAFPHGRRAFRAVHRCCFLGSCSPLGKDSVVVKLHCVGLHFGEREGLLAAAGSGKSGCSSCFADASERGVSPGLEVGGSACFPLALRSPGCGCFCLRLDFHATVSVRGSQGSQPCVLSACL